MADHRDAADLDTVEAAQPQSTLNPFRTFWRHKPLVALAVAAACVMGALYYARAAAVYESRAQVLVEKKVPEALRLAPGESRSSYTEDYLSTHQTLIRSPPSSAPPSRR